MQLRTILMLLLAGVVTTTALKLPDASDPCGSVDCRAGRECIVSGGVAQCLCVTSCPDHDKPVCGSDDTSYDNYCLLHQKACLTGVHIHVAHRGYCQKDINMAFEAFGITTMMSYPTTMRPFPTTTTTGATSKPVTTPVDDDLSVCFGPQRDALRNTIISHWQKSLRVQPWFTDGMSYKESLSGHFFACDKNRDYRLRPDELIDCFADMPFLPRPEQDLAVTRTLCTDALIESADGNRDWRLDFQEFTHLLDPMHHLTLKNCSLEGRDYTDGAEVRVECNHCVCATGSWVCATHNCPQSTTQKTISTTTAKTGTFGYMDTKFDLDDDKSDLLLDDDDDYEDYYDDDYLYDDDADDYIEEDAKKAYNSLSKSDKEKLTRLESNIKHFYADEKKWKQKEDAAIAAAAATTTTTEKTTEIETDVGEEEDEPLTSSEEEEDEEDDLLDEYDALLEKSQKVKEKLVSLKNAIHTLEERRRIHELKRKQKKEHRLNNRHYLNNGLHMNDVHSNDAALGGGHVNNDVIHHNSIIPGKHHAAHKKQQKYEAYRALMREKLERHRRLQSQTDNDIWGDHLKAKIKKHHRNNDVGNNLL